MPVSKAAVSRSVGRLCQKILFVGCYLDDLRRQTRTWIGRCRRGRSRVPHRRSLCGFRSGGGQAWCWNREGDNHAESRVSKLMYGCSQTRGDCFEKDTLETSSEWDPKVQEITRNITSCLCLLFWIVCCWKSTTAVWYPIFVVNCT